MMNATSGSMAQCQSNRSELYEVSTHECVMLALWDTLATDNSMRVHFTRVSKNVHAHC